MSSFVSAEEALGLNYRFDVIAEEEGGYTIVFPDLPGCMSQTEQAIDVGAVAEEIRVLWIESAQDIGMPIPAPTYPESFSGKFNVRMPKSLHRKLARQAADEGVSLNQWVVSLLSERSESAPSGIATRPLPKSQNAEHWQNLGGTTFVSTPETVVVGHAGNLMAPTAPMLSEEGTKTIRSNNIVAFEPRRRSRLESELDELLTVSV